MKLGWDWRRSAIGALSATMLIPAGVVAQDKDRIKLPPVQVSQVKTETAPQPATIQPDAEEKAPPICPNGTVPADKIKELILAEAARQGADAKLAVAISEQESGFGADNNSSQGARGPMQLVASTAAAYGVTDICDTVQNIRGGIAYLHDLNVEFGGNVYLMLAAYNAGSDRIYKAKGVPAIRETVDYVAKVSNAYFEFPNALQHARKSRPAALATPDRASATTEPATSINKPANEPPPADKWIGGSVLYVGN